MTEKFPEADVGLTTQNMLFPLGALLRRSGFDEWRYIQDETGFHWIPESEYGPWLRDSPFAEEKRKLQI